MTNTTDTIVLYHADCLDGYAAAWAVWTKYPNWEFKAVRYNEPPPTNLPLNVYLVDFSYDAATLAGMADTHYVTVLDHHKTAMADLQPLIDNGIVKGQFDMSRSGAMIAWDWFHPGEPVPMPLACVEDGDLWKFQYEMTRDVCAALYSYPFDDMPGFDRMMRQRIGMLVLEGNAINRTRQNQVRLIIDNTRRGLMIDGWFVPVCNAPKEYASDIGNQLAKGQPFAATYYDTETHRVFSLRSAVSSSWWQDVSLIAKQYGGGGHKHAAGFSVPRYHSLGIA